MISGNNDQRLLSQPLRLFWNGWESNTYDLQRHGWELSVQQDISRRTMEIAIRHQKAGIRGISDTLDWNYWAQINDDRYKYQIRDPRDLPGFNCFLASDISINHSNTGVSDVEFNPIDARPMYTKMKISSIDDLAHFRKIEKASNEIFLKEASLDQIMKMALSKQEPMQDQIRREMVRQNEINVMKQSQLRANLRLVS